MHTPWIRNLTLMVVIVCYFLYVVNGRTYSSRNRYYRGRYDSRGRDYGRGRDYSRGRGGGRSRGYSRGSIRDGYSPRSYPRSGGYSSTSTTYAPCLSEGSSCSTVTEGLQDCLLPQFQCHQNGRCISRTWQCNGIPDCIDGSDEFGCLTSSADSATSSTSVVELRENSPSSSTSTTEATLRYSEQEISTSPFTASSRIFQDFDDNMITTIGLLPSKYEYISVSSTSKTSTISPDSDTTIALTSSSTTKTMLPETEKTILLPRRMETEKKANTDVLSSTTNTILLDSKEEKLSPTKNSIISDTSPMPPCPEKYCKQNMGCIVLQGQHRCKCSSLNGELCEVKPSGRTRGLQEFAVAETYGIFNQITSKNRKSNTYFFLF